jgi:tetratricopeptide (TPR) repeat protein
MLEPVRQYALEKLEESGEEQGVRGRHTGHYLMLVEEAGVGLKGPDQGLWVGRLTTELDNVRAALEWATANGQAERIAEASWDSWTFWWSSGNISEGRRRMEDALAAQPDLPALVRAKLLFIAATLGQAVGDFRSAWTMVEEGRAVFEEAGFKRGVADAHGTGGLIALGLGRPDEGFDLMRKAVELDLEVGNEWGAAAMLGFSATVPFALGDLDRARSLAERGLELSRKIGARDILYVNLHALAAIALAEGDHELARRSFGEGAGLSLEVGEKVNVAFCLEGLAAIAAAGGDAARAARL